MGDYVGLRVSSADAHRMRWIKCLRTTAEFYGWIDVYPVIGERDPDVTQVRRFGPMPTKAWRPDVGGRRIRISRSPSRQGNPAGLVNQFRISRHVSNTDLAELARLTTPEWHWMEAAHGPILTRDQWLAQP